jgi:hypothetical protein
MVLRAPQVPRRQLPELPCNFAVALRGRQNRAALKKHNFRAGHGFAGIRVDVVDFKSEHVAGEVEGIDLTPAIAQQPIGANGARRDFVNIFGRFALPKNFGVALCGHNDARDASDFQQRTGPMEAGVACAFIRARQNRPAAPIVPSAGRRPPDAILTGYRCR